MVAVLPFLIIAVVLLVVFVVVAAVSDRRDRKAGYDPKVRTETVTEHRRQLKEHLYKGRARRLGWQDPDEKRRDPHR
jgi:hypothetical protein